MTNDPIIRKRELARALGTTTETVSRWCKAGRLPPFDVDISTHNRGWKESTLVAAGVNLRKAEVV